MRHTSILIVLTASTLLAQGHIHTSRPAARLLPLPKGDDVWHFAVFADRTGGPAEGIQVLRQAVEDTNLLDPDLVMTVGDLIQGYNEKPAWMKQMREFRGVMKGLRMPWFPVAGNHDIYWRGKGERPAGEHEGAYERHFGPLWYWFVHKNSAFVVLYTDEGDPGADRRDYRQPWSQKMSPEQLDWLAKALKEMRRHDHVFVFLHHPWWMKDRYSDSNWGEVHQLLVRAGNVSAVFAGHIHHMIYSGRRDGIEYYALATTGGNHGASIPRAGWLHHFDIVTVRKDRFTVSSLPVGAVMDPKAITQKLHDDVATLRGAKPVTVGRPLVLRRPTGRTGTTLRVENPLQRPIEATIAIDAPAGWRITPDHVHHEIAPGRTLEIDFSAVVTRSVLEAERFPEAEVTIDLLDEAGRITMPAVTSPLPLLYEGRIATRSRGGRLTLDGKGDSVRVDPVHLRLPQGALTVEGWIRARALKGRRPFVTKTENSEFGIFVSDGLARFMVHLDGKYVEARAPEEAKLQTNRWHHLAGVYDGTEVRLYIDGRRVASTEAKGGKRKTNSLPLYVGADPDRRGEPVDHLHGDIDEVRISRGARYTRDFQPSRHEARDERTILLLHLDESAGRFAPDSSGRNRHGRLRGDASIAR